MKIVLKDGTEIEHAMVGFTANSIDITLNKAEAVKYIHKFLDPDVMSQIEYCAGPWKTIYTGYSIMASMDPMQTDRVHIWMKGTPDAKVSDKLPAFPDMYMPKRMDTK